MTIEDYDSVYALWINTSRMGLNGLDDSKNVIDKYLISLLYILLLI